jgi:hypothetical protein
MGYSKVVAKDNGKVVFVHQLNPDGTAYAEDITIEVQDGVEPSRVDWSQRDGQVGVISVSFSPAPGDTSAVQFPTGDR